MNRFLHLFIFILGLAVACWIGARYVTTNPLALAVTVLIVAVYLVGAFELYRYQQATSTLTRALDGLSEPLSDLDEWLRRLAPGLRNAVRLRIEGERASLPGPALTPYLVGLLVLLGMLGTFLGMVATLRGTGLALESATDLHAIRASMAEPVKGLGFAFGTSVAGVATSAMLGLLSALCRRERIGAAQWLDTKIATTLRSYSLAHQREERLRLLQRQTEVLPAVVDKLAALMAAMDRHHQAMNERLAAGQESFQARTEAAYTRLAASVEQSLKEGIAEGARAAGTAIQPVAEATMSRLARESAALHDTVRDAVQQQLDGVSSHAQSAAAAVADALAQAWQAGLAQHERSSQKLADDNQQALTAAVAAMEQHAVSLVQAVGRSQDDLQARLASQDAQRLAAWTDTLSGMAAAQRSDWEQAGAHAASRQQEICDALAQTARDISSETQANAKATIAEIAKLLQTASEAPKAAAEVIGELRQKLSDSLARDNSMLEERSRLLETVGTLLDTINHASSEQRAAVDGLVNTSADVLNRVSTQFTGHIEAETGKLTQVAAQVANGAADVARLGDAFGVAVQQFSQSSVSLQERLERIEAAFDKSMTRSDEQLAYYVAQAREVVDLSILSQKQIIEELQQLADRGAPTGADAA
ncbi:DUF802 domain-containing protein [Pusillimonas sp. SM2304]|uniref:DUF802 domain-containing protein n=1 Tax=Pusillimonas sp. SM2304 TaxID=3073241 RepID=UPI0028765AB4|nr:DUF802 domain-containing protein [Pusillimonas sp. SM2304]MDS1140470.1 DUF802 domain-containing protein [Pusillimonas sp. SM2304]